MSYLLISKTFGDDLIDSKKKVIASSEKYETLARLLEERKTEREDWLAKWGEQLPWWAHCSLIEKEFIEEVPSI